MSTTAKRSIENLDEMTEAMKVNETDTLGRIHPERVGDTARLARRENRPLGEENGHGFQPLPL